MGTTEAFSLVIPVRKLSKEFVQYISSQFTILEKHQCQLIICLDNDIDNAEEFMRNNHWNQNNILLIKNISNQGKKGALDTAIKQAKYNKIVCTDMDCKWDESFIKYYKSISFENVLILGDVRLEYKKNFLETFQIVELIMLQNFKNFGIRIGKPLLANGANMAFDKKTYLKLNPFANNYEIASGDDMYLLQAYKQHHLEIYSANTVVETIAVNSFKGVYKQRFRWFAKMPQMKLPWTKWFGLISFLGNINKWFLVMFASIYNEPRYLLVLFFILLVEFFILLKDVLLSKRKYLLIWSPLMSMVYPLFLISFVFYYLFNVKQNKTNW